MKHVLNTRLPVRQDSREPTGWARSANSIEEPESLRAEKARVRNVYSFWVVYLTRGNFHTVCFDLICFAKQFVPSTRQPDTKAPTVLTGNVRSDAR